MSQETAALICRVSTREQEDGFSLDAQENLLREFSDKHRFEVLLINRFSETASKQSRRLKFRAFMDEAQKRGVRHIVVEKVDRLTRSGLREAMLIDDWLEADSARFLHCVKDGIDLNKFSKSGDKLNWGIRVVMAKNYTDNLREEVRKTTDAMLRQGIWPGKTPKGYVRDKAHPVSPIQPDPVRAPLIRRMFELYDSGDWSVERLEKRMFEEGYRTAKGRRLHSSHVHTILSDPFYVGQIRFEGKLWPGTHPPLVSRELFDRVQKRLRRPLGGTGAVQFQRHAHLYRGIVVCAGCGKFVNWEIQKGRGYGYCKGYGTCPARASIREDVLTEALPAYLDAFRLDSPELSRWLRGALKAAHASERGRLEDDRDLAQKQLASVEGRLGRVLDLRIDGSITQEEFERKREDLSRERDELLARSGRRARRQDDFLENVSTLIELTQDIGARFDRCSSEHKRTILLRVFGRIVVGRGDIAPEYSELFANLLGFLKSAKSSKTLRGSGLGAEVFEPRESGSGKEKEDVPGAGHPLWLEITEDFRTRVMDSWVARRLSESLGQIDAAEFQRLASDLSAAEAGI